MTTARLAPPGVRTGEVWAPRTERQYHRGRRELAGLLDSPEVARLIADLEETRWTGRPGYPIRAMVGVALAKSLYAIPTWTNRVALVREHEALREAIGGECPSV